MKGRIHEEVGARLRALDQRYTPQRHALIEVLANAEGPLTVPEILARTPELPQSSAYRCVTDLVEVGVLTRVVTSGEHWRVELSEDVSGHDHHHHLVCERCGAVADVPAPPALEKLLHSGAMALGSEYGFFVNEHRLDLVGLCQACGGKNEDALESD